MLIEEDASHDPNKALERAFAYLSGLCSQKRASCVKLTKLFVFCHHHHHRRHHQYLDFSKHKLQRLQNFNNQTMSF